MEPTEVGLILDSSVVITAERKGKTVREILEQIRTVHGEVELGLSVITAAELIHGAYRAQIAMQQKRRLNFIDEPCRDVPGFPHHTGNCPGSRTNSRRAGGQRHSLSV